MAAVKRSNQGERRISTAQMRMLHALWRRWMGPHAPDAVRSRELRHAYIEIVTQGRAHTTAELTRPDANWVIGLLARALRLAGQQPSPSPPQVPTGRPIRDRRLAFFAGTAGRHGYEKQKPIPVPAESLALLLDYAAALGMTRQRLDRFIAHRFRSRGLRSFADIRTLADCNAVLWGLKSILRRARAA
jgi:hypothetical protein